MAEKSEAELKVEAAKAEAAAKAQVDEAAEAAKREAQAAGLTQEDIVKAVERARSEEKDKLYPQIDALKASIEEIQAAFRAEREEKETIKRDAEAAAEAERQAKLTQEDRTTEMLRKIEEQLTREREERLATEARYQESQRKAQLSTYRADAIKAAGDDISPFVDFIRGESETEIDTAISTAKARAAEIAEKFKTTTGQAVRDGMPRSGIPDTAAFEEQELNELQKSVDMDKYASDAAYRKTVQEQIARAYESTGRI